MSSLFFIIYFSCIPLQRKQSAWEVERRGGQVRFEVIYKKSLNK